jgi:hypothetical protein
MHDRRKDIRSKLERAFQESFDDSQFNSMVDRISRTYGQVLEAELKEDGEGFKTYENAETKPSRKFCYAVRTARFEKGSRFLMVEIVPDGNRLAVSEFAIVAFPLGVPSDLQN